MNTATTTTRQAAPSKAMTPALFRMRPTYCPTCGNTLKWTGNSLSAWDARAVVDCPVCGFQYQKGI